MSNKHSITIRLSTNPYIKARQDNSVGGKGSQEQTKESKTLPTHQLSLLGVSQKTQPKPKHI